MAPKNERKLSEADLIKNLRIIFKPEHIEQPNSSNYESGHYFQVGKQAWRLNPKESIKFNETVQALHSRFPKVHFKTCQSYLERFCCKEFPQNYDLFGLKIPELFAQLQKEQINRSVVAIEVSGLRLDTEPFSFGQFEFVSSEDTSLDDLRDQIRDENGCPPPELPTDRVLAKIGLQGDSEFTRDSAKLLLQQALDVLQFVTAPKNPSLLRDETVQGFSFYIGEDRLPATERVWSYNTHPKEAWNSFRSNAKISYNSLPKFQPTFDSNTIKDLQEFGWEQFDILLTKQRFSYFERNLLAAVTWFARAVRDVDPARKFVDLFISLETLFSNDKKAPEKERNGAFNTREGVAYFLGKTTEQRLSLHHDVHQLASTRNKVVHSGYSIIEEGDLYRLFDLTFSSILKALDFTEQFTEPSSFTKWAKRIKLGDEVKVD